MNRSFGKYIFLEVTLIQPEHDSKGDISEFMPQSRYSNPKKLLLHKYGRGPFCKFRIARNFTFEGVYVFTVDEKLMYIGECENLSSRFNMGYGQISPAIVMKEDSVPTARLTI